MPGKKKYRLALILALLVMAGLFFVWRYFPTGAGEKRGMPMSLPPVRVAEAILQNVPWYLNGMGTVQPSGDVLVKSRVDGQLLRLHFREGQRVMAGDLLAEIDPRPFKAALEQAEGVLARDQAQLQNARRDLERYAKLARGDYIAEQQYETQRALVKQYEGTVEADKAEVDAAKLQLEYSRVTAPIGGRLGLRNVDEGNQIRASDADGLVRITETSPCDVLFTLPENQLNLVSQALAEREKHPALPPLTVEAWDRENRIQLATGVLLSMDNQIDSATGTLRLKARFKNEYGDLYPNQFVNIRLLVKILKNVVTVPAAAVQLGSQGSYCYIIKSDGAGENGQGDEAKGEVELVNVKTGITVSSVTVIEEGVMAGRLVVIDGLDRLRNGIEVKIAARAETPLVGLPDG